MFSFSSKPAAPALSAKEQVREWQKKLRGEMRSIDRNIRGIEREQVKVKREIQAAAKKNDRTVVRSLAREVVASRKAVTRMHANKAQINSVIMQLQQQAAMARVSKALQASTTIMTGMAKLINVPQLSETCRQMASEMQRQGLISEMMEDAMEAAEPEDMEEEADEAVEQVMHELTLGQFGSVPSAPVQQQVAAPAAAQPAARRAVGAGAVPPAAGGGGGGGAGGGGGDGGGGDGGELDDLQRRLAALG